MANYETFTKFMWLMKTSTTMKENTLSAPFEMSSFVGYKLGTQTEITRLPDGSIGIVVSYPNEKNPNALAFAKGDLLSLDFIPNTPAIKKGPANVRTLLGQYSFLTWAAARGASVKVPVEIFGQHDSLLIPFIEGSSLEQILLNEENGEKKSKAVEIAFQDILSAHQKSVVYGLRWPQNIYLSDDHTTVRHIAYDIELTGPLAEELEIAQFLTGILIKAYHNDAILEQLKTVIDSADFIKSSFNWETNQKDKYDLTQLQLLTHRYFHYKFRGTASELQKVHTVIDWLFSDRSS